jgi:hypothetical protein
MKTLGAEEERRKEKVMRGKKEERKRVGKAKKYGK